MNSGQATLFSNDAAAVRPFLLTNRYNLLEILASRLLGPIETFSKHYRDLLEVCPGRIPLVASPFREGLLDFVSAEDPAAFPVALEVDREVLGADTPLQAEDDEPIVWAPAGLIPITRVVAIHFRTAAELEEHRLRDYENVRHLDDLYRVSPDLFRQGDVDHSGVVEWLRSTSPPSTVTGTDGLPGDRLSGAIVLMASICPPVEGAVETLRRCLDSSAGRKGKRPFAEWLVAAVATRPTRHAEVDEVVLTASLGVFASLDASQAWRSVEVLETIQAVVEPLLDAPNRERLPEHFDRMRQILRSERPFERLRPHGPPAEKALLLALMRPDPLRLAGWSPEETGADWSVTLAASALVGALKGRRRMPVELRSAPVDDFLAAREAGSWNAAVRSTLALPPVNPIRLEASAVQDGRRLRMTAGRTLLGTWLVRDASSPPDPLAAWETTRDVQTEEALIALCDVLGWDDCTISYIDTSGRRLEQADPSGNIYSVPGLITVRRGINAPELRSRLESKDTSSVDRTRILALLERPTQSPPDSHRYSN